MTDFNSICSARAAAGFECIDVMLEEGIVTLTINRPAVRNAIHPQTCAELGRALDWCEEADDVRVVIITGAGERAFSAGFDLRHAESHPDVALDVDFGSELVRRLDRRKPLIAAVNGVAVGLGFELALACDLIIAAEHAKFGLPEPKVGLAALGGGVVRLTRQIGLKRALGLILTARQVSAREGYELGFVNEVATEPVLTVARRWAREIAACAPLSVIASKEAAYRNFDMPDLATALDLRNYPSALSLSASEDAQEGRRAFLERRKPHWQGR